MTSCFSEPKNVDTVASIDDSIFENGDIITRLGNGFFSNHFKKYSYSEKVFSHVGIIERIADSVFVYHAEASEFTGIGKVKREDIHIFLKNIQTWGLYRIDVQDATKTNIVHRAVIYYQNKTPFDLEFNTYDDAKVYCTELVANCVNGACQDSIVKPRLKRNGHIVIGIDDCYRNTSTHLVYKKLATE